VLSLDLRGEVEAALRALMPELRVMVRAEVEAALRESLLTVERAAELAATSPAAIRKRIARGTIPAVRHGRAVRLRREDVLALKG
jgi:excisionase family DNA binding protein